MQLSLKLHKEEVEERIERGEEELVQLRFRADAFREKVERKGEKEFLYQGVMYDIVDSERKGDDLLLTVYRDEEETQMRKEQEAVRDGQESEEEKSSEPSNNIQPFKYDRVGKPELQRSSSPRTLAGKEPRASFPAKHREVPVPPPC